MSEVVSEVFKLEILDFLSNSSQVEAPILATFEVKVLSVEIVPLDIGKDFLYRSRIKAVRTKEQMIYLYSAQSFQRHLGLVVPGVIQEQSNLLPEIWVFLLQQRSKMNDKVAESSGIVLSEPNPEPSSSLAANSCNDVDPVQSLGSAVDDPLVR